MVATAGCFGSWPWPLTSVVARISLLMEELHGQESCAFRVRVPMNTQKSRLMQIAGKNGNSKPYEAGELGIPDTLLGNTDSCSAHGLGTAAKHSLDVAAAEAPIRLRVLATRPKLLQLEPSQDLRMLQASLVRVHTPQGGNREGRWGPKLASTCQQLGSFSCRWQKMISFY